MAYVIWIPLTIILSALAAYLSHRLNTEKSAVISWIMWSLNLIPLWIFIARNSNNILFDGLVYDILLTVTYTITMILLVGASRHFTLVQYMGITIILIGLILFKLGDTL